MKALRIRLQAQTAHYRIPFMQLRYRQSYPLPPYSTIIGLMMNIMGEQERIAEFLSQQFGLFVSGRFGVITQEYVWYRNLHKKEHNKRPGEKGIIGDRSEHIGGQSPVTVEVLNDVQSVIYVCHTDNMLDLLGERLYQPDKWLSHLSLGRSEDWVTPVDCRCVELTLADESDYAWTAGWDGYCWLPSAAFAYRLSEWNLAGDYQQLYSRNAGNALLVTSLYKKMAVQQALIRNFQHVPAKLTTGAVGFIDFKLPQVLVDPELKKPVFPALIAQV